MGRKKSPLETDISRLQTKVRERSASATKVDEDLALRSLRKRLKRVQRKKRAIAMRKAHSSGKKTEVKAAEAKPAAATS
jgi:hypothetical protein